MDQRTEHCKSQYEGKHYFTKEGNKEFVITNYNAASDVTVEFLDSGFVKHTNIGNINTGLPNPFKKSCICFDNPLQSMLGCYFKTNQGYIVKIIAVETMNKLTYQFQDEFGHIGITTLQNLRKGQVRNPYHKNEFGGYLGIGNYNGDQYEHVYRVWYNMILRATGGRNKYNEYYQESQRYLNCIICNEWMCYNTFADWYIKQLSKLNSQFSYELDKDLLYPMYKNKTGELRMYSPITVVLIPHDLNMLIFNADKSNDHPSESCINKIIELSEYYHNNNAITDKAYNAIKARYYNNGQDKIYINFRGKDYLGNLYNTKL